ncbi:DNA cytosine methyltransferase [Stenotrophomonas bentonitica]|uniref:DNA cytosine methyltransferase n=1 Tax=Stenotrophomonas bentonitica TaxID=1450134 RepID=UPI00345EB549
MADGSRSFNFPMPQRSRLRRGEIVVDLFAGGGGASEGLKQALGIDPALAYNHDELAIGMHAANHPLTQHHREDIWHADPRRDVAGRPIGWFHASPDCTHFSQAKGGQPRSRKTRALSWVVLKWVGQLRRADALNGTNTAPRIISMENVWQILTWGPLVAKRCKATRRVLKMDGTVAARGERVPVECQQLVPDNRHKGRTWQQFVAALRALGYVVEWRKLVASDYGAGTSRERLFLLARRDGEAIIWPAASHGPGKDQQPRVTAADCLDFSIPCPSIFTRSRPLADATMRRIAKGVMRHVINSADPFIVPVTHQGSDRVHDVREPMRTITAANRGELMLAEPELAPFIAEHANASNQRTMPADEPLRTVCAGVKGGHFSVVAPTLVQTGYGERVGQAPRALDLQQPLGTVVAGGVKHAVAAPHLVKFRGESLGTAVSEPVPTITSGAGAVRPAGAAHALGVATAFMVQAAHGEGRPGGVQRWGSGSKPAAAPLGTVTASGNGGHAVAAAALVELSPEQEAGALQVAAFLVKYYASGIAVDLRDPLDTVTTKDRLALVTVMIRGTPYVIVDMGLRMLKPHELFRAQGFPQSYVIDRTANGTPLTTSAAVRMVGNSVSPPPLRALAEANLDPVVAPMAEAA